QPASTWGRARSSASPVPPAIPLAHTCTSRCTSTPTRAASVRWIRSRSCTRLAPRWRARRDGIWMMNPSPPPPIVPTPAVELADRLRGRRVIVGVPGVGFRDGLRADDVVVRDGRTYVPVLTEQDYYRVEIEEIEAIAP